MKDQNDTFSGLKKLDNDSIIRFESSDDDEIESKIDFKSYNENFEDMQNPRINSKIKWEEYNWPICIKLVHYDLNEIDSRIRHVFSMQYIALFIWIFFFLVKVFFYILITSDSITILLAFIVYFATIII